jgi:hypothetical protein
MINSELNDILTIENNINDINTLLTNFERKLTKLFFEIKLNIKLKKSYYDDKIKPKLTDDIIRLYNNYKDIIKNNIKYYTQFNILLDLIEFKEDDIDKELLQLYSDIKDLADSYDELILAINFDDDSNIFYLNDPNFNKKLSNLNVNDATKSKMAILCKQNKLLTNQLDDLANTCKNNKNSNNYKDKLNYLIEILRDNKFIN